MRSPSRSGLPRHRRDALVLALAKMLGADPAEVRKKRDENPQWFADVVAKYGLVGGKGDDAVPVKR